MNRFWQTFVWMLTFIFHLIKYDLKGHWRSQKLNFMFILISLTYVLMDNFLSLYLYVGREVRRHFGVFTNYYAVNDILYYYFYCLNKTYCMNINTEELIKIFLYTVDNEIALFKSKLFVCQFVNEWVSSFNRNFIIEKQIARHFVWYSKCLLPLLLSSMLHK